MDFIKYASSTVINPFVLKEQLKEIKKLGYYYIQNEFIDSIVSIAAPIKDHNKNIIAAVSLVGPIQRINGVKAQYFINKVLETSRKISLKMGYRD